MRRRDKFIKIGVKNFRLFKDKVEFDLSPLTIFTGPNNSGKSTLNKLLVFLSSCFDIGYFQEMQEVFIEDLENLSLSKHAINQIGDFEQNLNKNSQSETMDFYFTFENSNTSDEINVNLAYTLNHNDKNGHLKNNNEAILTEIIISINNEPILHVSKENMYNHYSNKNILNYELKRNHPLDDYKKRLTAKTANSEKLIWVSKHDSSFITTLRNYLLRYRDNRIDEELEKEKRINEGVSHVFEEKTDILFQTENKELLVRSHFCDSVLNDKSFFISRSNSKNDTSYYRKKLIEKGINSRKKYIEEYINFEKELIDSIYRFHYSSSNSLTALKDVKIKEEFPHAFQDVAREILSEELYLKLFDKIRNDIHKSSRSKANKFPSKFLKVLNNYSFIDSKKLKDILDYDNKIELNYNKIYDLLSSIKNPLTELFLNELETTSDIDDNNKNLTVNYFNVTYINKIYKLIVNDVINSFFTKFKRKFVENIYGHSTIFKQNIPILPHYLFENTELENSHLLEFGRKFINNDNRIERYLKFINKWIKKFKIGNQLVILPIKIKGDIIGFTFNLKKGKRINPLVEEGFGVQKLINILIFLAQERSINLIIEEPEANLHPSFQSMLAELFANEFFEEGSTFWGRRSIIIETHSEYLIRKLQYLIATEENELKADDVSIYYLHNPNNIQEREAQIYKMDIREDGFMNNDFGKGFFDEAASISLGLLNLKNFN